ncbi:hypothetical protein SRHO_G00056190 [Serrasalmus rhombeus]
MITSGCLLLCSVHAYSLCEEQHCIHLVRPVDTRHHFALWEMKSCTSCSVKVLRAAVTSLWLIAHWTVWTEGRQVPKVIKTFLLSSPVGLGRV